MANQPENQALQARDKEVLRPEHTRPGPFFRPDVDILEREDGYVIYADLPGVDDQSVDITLDRGTLTIDARLATLPDPSWRPLHREYQLGSYHREFRVSEEIDANAVEAKMHGGVLELHLPKSAEHRPRTIAVQAG